MTKECAKCEIDKPLNEFHKCSDNRDGLAYYCKQCRSEAAQKNKVHIAAQQRAWRDHPDNKEKALEQKREYYRENKEHFLEYSRENREHIYAEKAKRNHRYVGKAKETNRKRYHSPEGVEKRKNRTPEEKAEKNRKDREYQNNRRRTDPAFRLITNLRARTHQTIKSKSVTTVELLGCTPEFFRGHLENQFRPEMSWANYGSYWEIDHIRPCSSFDLTDEAQQRECFNYKNCQPLPAIENRQKQDKYEIEIVKVEKTEKGPEISVSSNNTNL